MNDTSSNLIDYLQVEQLDRYLFRGFTPPVTMARIYGGQVLAQAKNAAARTVEEGRKLHSLHAYFLRPGDPKRPIIFEVDPIRDGGSFTTRRVIAKQDGKAIFNTSLSFMAPCDGFSHQEPIEFTTSPEQVETVAELDARFRAKYGDRYESLPAVFPGWDIRWVDMPDPFEPENRPPRRDTWVRFQEPLSDDPLVHQTLLAYMSDLGLMAAALMPHRITHLHNPVQAASLDHAMWFHNPCRVDEWLLYVAESHWSGGGRGLNIGRIYTRDGLLVATTTQEGLMRPLRQD